MAHPHWPLFDLEVSTPRLTMRYIDDELATELASLAASGIHDPDWMPFAMPWSNIPVTILRMFCRSADVEGVFQKFFRSRIDVFSRSLF